MFNHHLKKETILRTFLTEHCCYNGKQAPNQAITVKGRAIRSNILRLLYMTITESEIQYEIATDRHYIKGIRMYCNVKYRERSSWLFHQLYITAIVFIGAPRNFQYDFSYLESSKHLHMQGTSCVQFQMQHTCIVCIYRDH